MKYSQQRHINQESFGHSFLHDEPVDIYKQCTTEFQHMIPSSEFKEMISNFNQGVKSYHLHQKISLGPYIHYIWLDDKEKKAISVYFDEEDVIHRLLIKPYITYSETDDRFSEISYSMPVQEHWTVFWGGANEFVNYHYAYPTQRYAFDLLIIENGDSFSGSPNQNENYHAFDKNVTAPAYGKVIKIVDNVKDNIPGEMNEMKPAGNYVIIQHSKEEYSMIAHFKTSSIIVKKGDFVEEGQVIGLCGNSGNSSEPHIHFQVMDRPELEKCQSLRMRFNDGRKPIQGDIVTQSINDTDQNPNKKSMDIFDKAEISLTFSDIILFIPRLIGRFFN